MSAYVIVEFTVKDPEMYREKYAPIAGQTAKEHGGEERVRYAVRARTCRSGRAARWAVACLPLDC